MSRLLVAALTALLVLSACGSGGVDDVTPAAAGTTFTGQGIVLPVPEGWSIQETLLQRGLIVAQPDAAGDPQEQETEGASPTPGAETDPEDQQVFFVMPDVGSSFPGAAAEEVTMEQLLEQLRGGVDQEPSVDQPIEVEGAQQAHLLTYEGLEQEPQEGSTADPVQASATIILAQNGERFSLFRYVAEQGAYDESIAALLRTGVALSPDSERTGPPTPAASPSPTG